MSDELTWLPAWRIAKMIAKREVSAVEVTQHFLRRIEDLNPKLHAFDYVDVPGALERAERADRVVHAGEDIGPLHGIPTAVTNTFKVKGLPSKIWDLDKARNDTIGIERLRHAGMVMVGTAETYFFEEDERPRNPWDLSKEPGNSSRGSAVAAAAAMLPITIGADSAGSTRLPAAFSGVVGVHPTRGLMPHVDYDHPSVQLITSIGPLARNVRDCAIATQIMAGPDGRDFLCIQDDPPDYLARIDDGVKGLRMAWTDDFGWSSELALEESSRVIELVRSAAMGMTSLGAAVATTNEVWERLPTFLPQFAASTFGSVSLLPPKIGEVVGKRMAAIAAAEGLPSPSLDLQAPPMTAEEYQAMAETRARNWERTRRVFRDHDVLLCATTPMVTRPPKEWGLLGIDRFPTYGVHTEMFSALGFPAVSVPCGFLDGLPVGLQIAARPGREDVIFRVANAFQKAYPRNERPPMI